MQNYNMQPQLQGQVNYNPYVEEVIVPEVNFPEPIQPANQSAISATPEQPRETYISNVPVSGLLNYSSGQYIHPADTYKFFQEGGHLPELQQQYLDKQLNLSQALAQDKYEKTNSLNQILFGKAGTPNSPYYTVNDNPIYNAAENLLYGTERIGTGGVNLYNAGVALAKRELGLPLTQDDKLTLGEYNKAANEWLNFASPEQKMADVGQLVFGNIWNQENQNRLAEGSDVVSELVDNFVRDPIGFTLDASLIGGLVKAPLKWASRFGKADEVAKAIEQGNAVRGMQTSEKLSPSFQTPKFEVMNPKQKAVAVNNIANSAANSNLINVENSLNTLRDVKQADLEKAIETATIGNKAILDTESAVDAYNKLKSVSQVYDTAVRPQSTLYGSVADPTIQRIAVLNGINYADAETKINEVIARAEKIGVAEKELIKPSEGIPTIPKNTKQLGLEKLAEDGDELALQILESEVAKNKGDIFLVPQAGIKRYSELTSQDSAGRILYGANSSRYIGNHSYEAQAKNLLDPNNFIQSAVEEHTNDILNGLVKSGVVNATEKSKNIKYINPESINNTKNIDDILKGASDEAKEGKIAIDADVLKEIVEYKNRERGVNPYKTEDIAHDLYTMQKSAALASGTYLTGNFTTGAWNSLINSGVNWGSDFVDAATTQGDLAKALGVYRRNTLLSNDIDIPKYTKIGDIPKIAGSSVMKGTTNFNNAIGSMWNVIDAKQQNLWAEMAAHRNLAEKGVAPAERLDYLRGLDKLELSKIIEDVQDVALLNNGRAVVPSKFRNIAALGNPFFRYSETAAISSLNQIKKHPIKTDFLYNHLMGNIGYNQELQHRLNIGVESDKPFVHIKLDNKGNFKDVSTEYYPMGNTMRIMNSGVNAIMGKGNLSDAIGSASPIYTTLYQTFSGVDKYGRPISRSFNPDDARMYAYDYSNNKRYKFVEGQGYVPVGLQADEVLATAATNYFALPNLINQTVLPYTALGLSLMSGQDINFYKPYQQSLFGEIGNYAEPEQGNLFRSRNMQRVVTPAQSLNRLFGEYEYSHREEGGNLTGKQQRRINRMNKRTTGKSFGGLE